MPARTSWKGFLKLSLVSVPVKAFTANNTSEEIRLNQLHKECHNRVRYQKVCPEHGVLKSEDIVSGYEYSKDHYVVIEPDELDKMRSASDRSVNIDGFVAADEVDPRYFAGRAYYLLPDGVAGEKPYALLHQGMVDNGVHAIAQVVISGREQLVLVRPVENLLVMTVIYYPQKVKEPDEFRGEVEDIELGKDELKLTETLIAASRIENFDIHAYKDQYVAKLRKLIELKVAGKEIVQVPDHEEPKIINLMDALKKSVAEAQAKGGSGKAGKRMAPSARKKKARSKKKSG